MAAQAGLSHTWSQTPEDRFSCDVPHLLASSDTVPNRNLIKLLKQL